MATNKLQITELDFDTIKNNLKNFLRNQDQFRDYDFEGAGLNILLDILAYNTHYNAYYLNMVANESFLDTAIIRDSVVSHAKTLGYLPYSTKASKASIKMTLIPGDTKPDSVNIPRGFNFRSNQVDGIVYNFVTLNDYTVSKSIANTYVFDQVDIYEGQMVTYSFNYDEATNPKAAFTIPDANIDTNSLKVYVRSSYSNTTIENYNYASDVLDVTGDSSIFFLQESRNQQYQVYFGDGVLGRKLTDGSIVTLEYLNTSGAIANKCADFVNADSVGNIDNYLISTIFASSGGASRESIEEIKLNAAYQFTSQNRLVTVKDYESYIKKQYPAVDSLSVWGGEDELPPVYGKVFVSLKPKENYYITQTEKTRLITDILRPKSVVAVDIEIKDPEYTYLILNNKITYQRNKTLLDDNGLDAAIRSSIATYNNTYLNKFGSTFVLSKLQEYINGYTDSFNLYRSSIVGSHSVVHLEKTFEPQLNTNKTYVLNFNTSLYRGSILDKLTTTQFYTYDKTGANLICSIEEVPGSFSGITQINITEAGYGYTEAPTVTITGDGTGASATASIVNGKVQSITVNNRGSNYSKAVVTIQGGNGYGAKAVAVLDSRFGFLRVINYDKTTSEKIIVNDNSGTIDYDTGQIIIKNVNILGNESVDGLIHVYVQPDSGIIPSKRNSIISINTTSPESIVNIITAI